MTEVILAALIVSQMIAAAGFARGNAYLSGLGCFGAGWAGAFLMVRP